MGFVKRFEKSVSIAVSISPAYVSQPFYNDFWNEAQLISHTSVDKVVQFDIDFSQLL